jgi:hypothetical protein
MPIDHFLHDAHRASELGVALTVSLGVFVSAAALAFSYVHEKVQQLQQTLVVPEKQN